MSDNAPTPELVALLASDPVTMFAMAEAFRKAHDEHTGLKVAKIYAAGQRAEANVIVGLRAALEVLSTRAATVPQGVSTFMADSAFLRHVASVCRGAVDLCEPKPQRTPEDDREHNGGLCLSELANIADTIDAAMTPQQGG